MGGKVKVDLNGVKIESKKELERRERLRNTDKKRSFIENKMEAKKCEAVRKSKSKELLLRSQIIVLTIVKYVVKIIEMFIQFLISVLGVMGFAIIIFVMVFYRRIRFWVFLFPTIYKIFSIPKFIIITIINTSIT